MNDGLIPTEIITIGDELLLGQVVDSNSAWMAQQLALHGARVLRISAVGDQRESILAALSAAATNAQLVLLTGGLGPTRDDLTKGLLLEYFGGELRHDPQIFADVKERFRHHAMPQVNWEQANIPSSCRPLHNFWGTAPGLWFTQGGCDFIAMPGVPHEMQGLLSTYILPWLAQRNTTFYHRSVMVVNYSESQLMELISDWEEHLAPFTLAYLPSPGIIRLRLSCPAPLGQDPSNLAQEKIAQLGQLLGSNLIEQPCEHLEKLVLNLLQQQGLSLATVESCSGGYLSYLLSRWDGSSAVFRGSMVCYSHESKISLGVDEQLLSQHGAVSEQVVIQMAQQIRLRLHSNLALATTGLLGEVPKGETAAAGCVWLAATDGEQTLTQQLQLRHDDRIRNIERVSIQALLLLYRLLLGASSPQK